MGHGCKGSMRGMAVRFRKGWGCRVLWGRSCKVLQRVGL